VWNEVFTFDVDSGKEILDITAFDHDDFGSDDYLGRFALQLEKYMDQQPHDEWFDLLPEKVGVAQDWHGRLRLVIQYVYSKTRVLTGYINLWTEQLENEELELRDLSEVLLHMESPFGFIKGFQLEQKVVV
jgi:C2 domain